MMCFWKKMEENWTVRIFQHASGSPYNIKFRSDGNRIVVEVPYTEIPALSLSLSQILGRIDRIRPGDWWGNFRMFRIPDVNNPRYLFQIWSNSHLDSGDFADILVNFWNLDIRWLFDCILNIQKFSRSSVLILFILPNIRESAGIPVYGTVNHKCILTDLVKQSPDIGILEMENFHISIISG